jgi:hypothetical protein
MFADVQDVYIFCCGAFVIWYSSCTREKATQYPFHSGG